MVNKRLVLITASALLSLGAAMCPGIVSVAAGTRMVTPYHAAAPVQPAQDIHIRYDTPASPPAVQQDAAIATARVILGNRADQATQVSAQYVLFTKEDYFTSDASGQKHLIWERIPAWVVTFEGLTLPSHGWTAGTPASVNHEANVVVHAGTGKPLMWFTYR